jgi:flagellin
MPLNIISNFAANVAHRNLQMNDAAATNSLAKLSAGTRVLSAKDDAAAMAVGNRLAADVAGLKQAQVNAGQGVSMLQIADGAMSKTNDILQRMKTLAVQAGSGQLSSTERSMLDTEYTALVSEIDRIANDTEFAGTSLVDGSIAVDLTTATAFDATTDAVLSITAKGDFAVASDATISYATTGTFSFSHNGLNYSGSLASDTNDGSAMNTGTVVSLTNATTDRTVDLVIGQAFDVDAAHAAGTIGLSGSSEASFTYKVGTGTSTTADDISVNVSSISATNLGVTSTDLTNEANADAASAAISNAIDNVQTYRAEVGANQNRLEFASANIATTVENTEAARSALMDLDVAQEMASFTSKQILVQAGVSMLAQANQLPQNLLRLFG